MKIKCLAFLVSILVGCTVQLSAQISEKKWERFTENGINQSPYRIIFASKPLSAAELATNEITVIRKLDKNTFIIAGENNKINVLRNNSGYKIYPVNNSWKLSPNIKKEGSTVNYYSIKTIDQDAINLIKSFKDIEVIKSLGNGLLIRCASEIIYNKIINLPEIVFIGKEDIDPTSESRVIDLNLNPNHVNVIHHKYPELNGAGMIVSIKDQLYNINDIDIKNRHITTGKESSTVANHATDMATVIAGAGNSFINGKGVAPAAEITSSDFNPVSPDEYSYYQELDIWVQNHSYGTTVENFYGILAESFDKSANENPQLLHVFSSGNQGTADGTGNYEGVNGFANLTGNYKMAKNILVVGAVDTVGRAMHFSSKGPAYDGRIKPELVAYSTTGTSNSTALASGISLLLQQAYFQEEGEFPPSALLRGILINTAKDAGPPGIDYSTGYGSIDANNALDVLYNKKYFSGAIEDDEVVQFNLDIPTGAENLKVSLVWNDPAAMPNAEIALVNDLDLKLKYNSEVWLPWVLDPSPGNLTDLPFRDEDHLNNAELISIDDPSPGNYTIEIRGRDVPDGAQEFYVIYNFDIKDEFEWLFPTGSDNMPYDGETGSYFRWKSTFSELNGKLEYTIDEGETWILIEENINLKEGHYRWDPPEVYAKAVAKMTIAGENIFTSDTFTISRPLKINVGFDCADSVLISWNPIPGEISYEVYSIGEMFAENFATTKDTFLIYQKQEINSPFVAVQPVFSDRKEMIRSYMHNVDLQGIGCYIKSFLSEGIDDEGIYLTLSLGTAYGVKEVFFERWEKSEFNKIGTIESIGFENVFFDEAPQEGLNIYRAGVNFFNGETIYSNEASSFYLSDNSFIVYPNPVFKEDYLNILSKDFGDQQVIFTLFNQLGNVVRTLKLISSHEYIPLDGLPSGFYTYKIETVGIEYKGKLVIN